MTGERSRPDGGSIGAARRAIGLIDLTDLADDSTADAVRALCGRAAAHGTAAVCVWPDFVSVAADELAGSPVRVATVVNFPAGTDRAFAVQVLTERALADGADEIDVVLPYRSWLAGDDARAAAVLDAVRHACDDGVDGATMKVILETGELPDVDAVARAARFAVEHGADFVKTSTGKTERSATPETVGAMLAVVASSDRPVGIKPSGGIRTPDDAATYLALADAVMGDAWASPATFRFGASGLLDALAAVVEPGSDAAGGVEDY